MRMLAIIGFILASAHVQAAPEVILPEIVIEAGPVFTFMLLSNVAQDTIEIFEI